MSKSLPFKISSNLKNIIGKDLINDKYIAVFELVKNAYDAGAHNVCIEFINGEIPKIIIEDDGCGMSYDDIINKWLFVAYSEKKEANLAKKGKDYRQKLKRQFAGAKGVGRFSCDRLGSKLELITATENSEVEHVLKIDWAKFEEDDEKEFVNIAVEYDSIQRKSHNSETGTKLIISGLRELWDRNSILTLKKSLMKLVNPQEDGAELDKFSIRLIARDEIENDEKTKKENLKKGIDDFSYSIVNGEIINNIFDKLKIKTTSLEVIIAEDGNSISTTLHDRGVFVFKYKENNEKYDELKNIHCKVFYMNRAAKVNFTKQMGTEPINYGSIFVYKNSFRVYPYGEPGRDFFEIDRRKTQGYNRYFGTREIMGEIKIKGDNNYFYETTSRDGGFVRNNSVEQLENFFREKVLRVLEKYVVEGIRWGDPERDKYISGINEQGLMPYDVKDVIIKQFVAIKSRSSVIEAEINEEFITDASSTKSDFDKKLYELKNLAGQSGDSVKKLADSIQKEAEKIRTRQYEAEAEHEKTREELQRVEREVVTRKLQNEANIKKINKNVLYLEDGHHLINKFATEIAVNLKALARELKGNDDAIQLIDEIFCWNNRIKQLSNLATKGNFDFKGRKPADLIEFIKELIKEHPMSKYISINLLYSQHQIVLNYIPSDIAVIFDNIVDNSYKAKAKKLDINVEKTNDFVFLTFTDDGKGLSPEIKDYESIFEVSYSKTGGTGLGLSHVKRIAKENGGDAKYISKEKGFCLQVRIKYESRFQNPMV